MNSLKNVSQQTIATLYLLKHDFNISLDFDKEGIKPSEIIDVALKETNNDLELMKGEGYELLKLLNLNKEQINNNLTSNKNIKKFRSKSKNLGSISGSSYTDNLSSSSSSIEIDFGFTNSNYKLHPSTQTNYNNNNNNIIKTTSNNNLHVIPNNQYDNQYDKQYDKQYIEKISKHQQQLNNINMKCEIPETHTNHEKDKNFRNLYPTITNTNYNNDNKYHNNNFSLHSTIHPIESIPTASAPPDYNI